MSTTNQAKHLLQILETLPGAVFVLDDATTIVYANASAQAILGTTREDVVGKPLWRGASQLVSTALYQAVQQTRQTQAPTEVEYVSPVTGTWLHVQLAPTIGGLMVQVHQGRAAARREAPVPQGECLSIEDLDGLFSRIGVLTPEGIVLEINEVPLAQARVRREEVIGHSLAQTRWWSCAPTSQAQLCAAIARASRGETVRFETVVHPREGMSLHLEATITPRRDVDHHVEYLVYVGTDITERKRAEAEIHALIDAIPQLVWTTQPDGSQDSCNQRWRDYTGLNTEEAQGEGWMQCLHPEDRQRVRSVWQRAVQTGGVYETELRLRHGTTGEYRWFLARAMPVRDERGQILKWFGTNTDIEEQKRAEQRIKESEENWRVLAETVPQLVWMARPDGALEYWNQRWYAYSGSSPEQALGSGWSQFLHPDDYEHTLTIWHHALAVGEPYEIEYRLKEGQTGAYRWFLARGMPMRDADGHILKWFGTCTDIHDKKQVEDEIRVLVDAIPQFVWMLRPDGSCEYTNQRWCDYTNMTSEQAQGDGWLHQAIHPDDQQRVLEVWQRAVQAGRPYETELRLRNGTTGEYRWSLARGVPFKDAQGTILKWFGTNTDIEEQKQAEQRIKASEKNWRVLAETVPQLVWTARPDGRLEYANQRACDYLGASPESILGDEWSQFLHPDDYERTLTIWHHALAVGEPYEIENRLKEGQTGVYRWFLTRGVPVRDEAGQIVKWFGTGTDIDDQKRIEEALRQSQERANALMNSNIIGIEITEGELVVDANDTYLRMTGYSREDVCAGRINWMQMTPPQYLARTLQAQQELDTQHAIVPYEKEVVGKDGNRLPVLVGAVALRLDPHQTIGFVLDNSARKELDQRKDDFINMASHELRNPLTALKMQIQLARRRQQKQSHDEAVTVLSTLEKPIEQLERLIGELLDVSKIQAGKLEYRQGQVDLNELLQEIVNTVQYSYPDHSIVVRAPVRACMIGDRDRLGQVFTNLISNAIKYSPQAETVDVEMDTTEDVVTVRVRDHGLGIPREQCEKIFERFYRVANPRQKGIAGLGMGLYIAARIVKHHKGTITVESELGKGSTFTVTLPNMRCA